MAHHDFSALLRRRRNLFRLRDGADAGHTYPKVLLPGRFHHCPALEQFGESDAGDWADCGVRLRDRSLYGLVQRQSLRCISAVEPPAWPVCVLLLSVIGVQLRYPAGAFDL